MRYLKRLGVVASMAVVASIGMAGTASAAEVAVCQLDGVAGQLLPNGVQLIGGGGNYSFSGSTTCRYSNGGAPVTDVGTITSAGVFTNHVCGTGTADSVNQTTVNFPAGSPIPNVSGITYHIDFVAAQGALNISAASDSHGHSGGRGGGEVTIIPSEGSCTTAVTQFQVLGGFTIALA